MLTCALCDAVLLSFWLQDAVTIIPMAGMLAVLGSEITLLLAVRALPGFLPKAFDQVAVTVDENMPKVCTTPSLQYPPALHRCEHARTHTYTRAHVLT